MITEWNKTDYKIPHKNGRSPISSRECRVPGLLSNVFIKKEHLYILMQEYISNVLIKMNTLI